MSELVQLKEVKHKRYTLSNQMKALVDTSEKEDRDFSKDEQEKWDKMLADVELYDKRIKRIEESRDLFNDLDQANDEQLKKEDRVNGGPMAITDEQLDKLIARVGTREKPESETDKEKRAHEQAFSRWIRGGKNDRGFDFLTKEDQAVLRKYDTSSMEYRAQGTTPPSEGGVLVPEGFSGFITEGLKAFGGIRNIATVLPTATGNDLPFPEENDANTNIGAILAEHAQDSEQDVAFTEVVLKAFKYTSNFVRVSVELMQDSAFPMDSFLGRKLGQRVARAQANHYAVGVGTTTPFGITVASGLGHTAANNADVTYDDLIALKHSVDPAYRTNARWVWSDSTFLSIKSEKDLNGRPLLQPAVSEAAADRYDGDMYVIDNDMPAIASTSVPVTYGDHSYYYVREVLGITVSRLVELYALNHQIAFVAIARSDGNLIDAAAGSVKHLQMAV